MRYSLISIWASLTLTSLLIGCGTTELTTLSLESTNSLVAKEVETTSTDTDETTALLSVGNLPGGFRFSPRVAEVGSTLTLAGRALADVTSVIFLGSEETSTDDLVVTDIMRISPNKIELTVPTGALSGRLQIQTSQSQQETSLRVLQILTTVQFEDPNLERVVRGAAGKLTGPLFLSDVEALTELDGSFAGIASLEGIEALKNLETLILIDNQITDLSPLSSLTNLQALNVQSNELSDLSPLAGLISLTSLVAGVNQVSDISSLSTLINLRTLDLFNNQIQDISPISSLTGLQTLLLGSNQIEDLSGLSTLTNLEELFIGNNQIENLDPLSSLTNLKLLYLFDNSITNISVLSELENLQILDLQINRIISIASVENLTKLEELYLSNNQIISTNSLSELINLRRLELANNFIFNIQPLVDNLGLADGDFISLGGNPLSPNSENVLIPSLEERGVVVDLLTF